MKRAAAIDLGSTRVGVAVADELGLMAHPRPYLPGADLRRLVHLLVALAAAEGVEHFVVGLPRRLDGTDSPSTRRARRFAADLAGRSGLTVELRDEWLTTREAGARLREQGLDARASRERVDSAAAAVLLQSWLDEHRSA